MLSLRWTIRLPEFPARKVNVRKMSLGKRGLPRLPKSLRDVGDYFLTRLNPQVRHCGHSAICPFPTRVSRPLQPILHSEPPTATWAWKDTSASLSLWLRSRERSRETPGFSVTESGKQSLRKMSRSRGHIFPSKHCKVSRGFHMTLMSWYVFVVFRTAGPISGSGGHTHI